MSTTPTHTPAKNTLHQRVWFLAGRKILILIQLRVTHYLVFWPTNKQSTLPECLLLQAQTQAIKSGRHCIIPQLPDLYSVIRYVYLAASRLIWLGAKSYWVELHTSLHPSQVTDINCGFGKNDNKLSPNELHCLSCFTGTEQPVYVLKKMLPGYGIWCHKIFNASN